MKTNLRTYVKVPTQATIKRDSLPRRMIQVSENPYVARSNNTNEQPTPEPYSTGSETTAKFLLVAILLASVLFLMLGG